MHLVEDGKPVFERRGILDREHRGNTSSWKGIFHLPGIAYLSDFIGMRFELASEICRDLGIELVGRHSCLGEIVWHPDSKALAPAASLGHALERELHAVMKQVVSFLDW